MKTITTFYIKPGKYRTLHFLNIKNKPDTVDHRGYSVARRFQAFVCFCVMISANPLGGSPPVWTAIGVSSGIYRPSETTTAGLVISIRGACQEPRHTQR